MKININGKKETVDLNNIYQHYRGGLYKIKEIAFDSKFNEPYIVYYAVNEKGNRIELKDKTNLNENALQPFVRSAKSWFEFVIKRDAYMTKYIRRFNKL